MKSAYRGVFYENDFGYLDDPFYDGPSFLGDSMKGMFDDRVDVGGEIRVRFHDERNHRGFGLTGRDDSFWLTRYRMFLDYQISDHLRFFGEYIYADSGGETFASRSIEVNRGDAQNLFVDVDLTESLTARGGRQELLYGNQRLISPLDWANTRRTFDGYRLLYSGTDWKVDGFYVHPVKRTPEYNDRWDATNRDVDFFGVYAQRPDTAVGTFEPYYLGLKNRVADFDDHTIGSRVFGESTSGLKYEFEGGVQFGENAPGFGNHDAGFFTAGLGRQLRWHTPIGAWTPTVWLWYDWASGGDDVPAARGDDSFDHLFPLAHKYNGLMDLFGRRNLNDVNVQFTTPVLGDRVSLLLWYHYFFLDEKTTPYDVTMTPFNPANAAGDRELGHEIDVVLTAAINPRNTALIGYSYFNAGKYYETTGGIPSGSPARGDHDAQFFYFTYQMRF